MRDKDCLGLFLSTLPRIALDTSDWEAKVAVIPD